MTEDHPAVRERQERGLRILVFYQYFTLPTGTYSTRFYEFARRWVKAGAEVTIVTSVYDKSGITVDRPLTKLSIEGIDVRVINLRLSQKHGKVLRLATFAAYAALCSWYAISRRADVVLCSSGPLTVGLPGLVARYLGGLPMVFEVRDLWPEGAIQLGILRSALAIRAAQALERACYGGARKIVALSVGMAESIGSRYPGRDVTVIPNCADNELFGTPEPTPPAQPPRVVYAGSIGLIDDCRQIVEMAAALREAGGENVEVVVAGDGSERAGLEGLVRARNLTNIRFLGPVPKVDLVSLLRGSTCALFTVKPVPFLGTASPNKVFDAFAAGLPVVQTSQGWVRDLVARERCGLTVPGDDPRAFAAAVMSLVREGSLRDEFARNASRVAREQFDRGRLAEQYLQLLAAAAGRSGGPVGGDRRDEGCAGPAARC